MSKSNKRITPTNMNYDDDDDEKSPLHKAIDSGKTQQIVSLMTNVNIDIELMMHAARVNDTAFGALLEGRQYTRKFLLGLLESLCRSNYITSVKRLLALPTFNNNANVTLNDDADPYYIHYGPLRIAILCGHFDLASVLIEKGALESKNQCSLLRSAIDHYPNANTNSITMLQLLLDAGVRENIDSCADTAYHNNKIEIVNMLARYGACKGTYNERQQVEVIAQRKYYVTFIFNVIIVILLWRIFEGFTRRHVRK